VVCEPGAVAEFLHLESPQRKYHKYGEIETKRLQISLQDVLNKSIHILSFSSSFKLRFLCGD